MRSVYYHNIWSMKLWLTELMQNVVLYHTWQVGRFTGSECRKMQTWHEWDSHPKIWLCCWYLLLHMDFRCSECTCVIYSMEQGMFICNTSVNDASLKNNYRFVKKKKKFNINSATWMNNIQNGGNISTTGSLLPKVR